MVTSTKRVLALGLFDIGAVRFGQFRLKLHEKHPDAPLSPIYIDLRLLRSFPRVMEAAVDAYLELTGGLKFQCYADVPTAATPIVAVLSHKTSVPMISPRADKKEHGMRRQIDGVFKPGDVALVVDDLITLAHSKLEAISILEENSLIVHDVAVMVDREQGGVQELRKRGYTCHVVYEVTELLKRFLEEGKISEDQFKRTMMYLSRT